MVCKRGVVTHLVWLRLGCSLTVWGWVVKETECLFNGLNISLGVVGTH